MKNTLSKFKKTVRRLVYSSVTALSIFTGFAYYGHENQKIETKNIASEELEQTITVMSANIAACRGRPFSFWDLFPNPVTTLWHGGMSYNGCKKLEQLVREQEVAIAGFQEIEQSEVRQENQPELFSKNTDLKNYSFSTNITHRFGHFGAISPGWYLADGNAVFSKTPITGSIWIPLEEEKQFSWGTIFDSLVGTEGIQHVTIKYQNHLINVINVHLSNEEFTYQKLKNGTIRRERELEFRSVFEYAAKITKLGPTILLGDWNSVPPTMRNQNFPDTNGKYTGERTWESALEIITREGLVLDDANVLNTVIQKGSYHGVVPTKELGFPNLRKDTCERIDFIMTLYDPIANKIVPRILETNVLDSYLISDHFPVIATIRFEENEQY